MTGKEKCEALRAIRREVAEANGIQMEFPPCPHEGECLSGTCPACENEALNLLLQISEKERQGEPIRLQGLVDQVAQDIPMSEAPMYGVPEEKEENDLRIEVVEYEKPEEPLHPGPLMGSIVVPIEEIEARTKQDWQQQNIADDKGSAADRKK